MTGDIVAIILGRKGSKGFKNKNTMKILGKPAYQYSIDAANKTKQISKIYFSTDIEEIINNSKKLGIKIIPRPKYLANSKALFEDALADAYKKVKKIHKNKISLVVILMANSVTLNSKLIIKGINLLNKNKKADSAVTVSIFNMYSPLRARKLNNKGFLEPFVPFNYFGNPKNLNCDRDSQGDTYFADMSFSITRAHSLDKIEDGLLPQKWMGKKILPVFNNNGCDIDEDWQLDMSIRWIKHNKKNK